MCQHHNHSYLGYVPLNRKMDWAPPLGWVVFAPTGILPLIIPTSTLVTPGVSLVVVLVTLVTVLTLVTIVTLVTLVLVSSVEITLVTLVYLISLVLGTLVTRPMVILGLLVVIHQERWYL